MAASRSRLRDRLSEGDRRELGAAGSVADAIVGDPVLVGDLIACLDDDDPAVVAHAAHAAMQVSARQPSLFDPHIEGLIARLEALKQWEIGEQLLKILVRLPLSSEQAERLYRILGENLQSRFTIVAACSLQAVIDLASDGLIDAAKARKTLDAALASDRKALSARARKLQKAAASLL